jgi:flavin reductase (DIM6/NTAB) family NADH-FMN oxidoreductase RutF
MMMELVPKALAPEMQAKLMLGLVVPRPIAVVSTISVEGHLNIASFSYYNAVSDAPMVLSFSITAPKPDGSLKDTLRNVRLPEEGGVGEFVVNVAGEHYAEAVACVGQSLPYGVSEFELAGLTPAPSRTVRAPRIAQARASFECKTLQIVKAGTADLVLGLVTHVWIDDELADERLRIDPRKLKPIARMAGKHYCRTTDIFEQ